MRVRVDRGAGAVRLELGEAPEARRVAAAEGVAVLYDAAERIVGVEVRGVDPAAWHEFSVELAGLADRPAAPAAAPGRPAPLPPPTPYAGPLAWDPEAEAAVLQSPFFTRGRLRLAASALARRRGLDRVTLDILRAAGL